MDSEGKPVLERHRLQSEPISKPVGQPVDYRGEHDESDYFPLQLFIGDDLRVEHSEGCDEDGDGKWHGVQKGGLRTLVALSLEAPTALDLSIIHI